jgi:hypothetical protein
MYWLRIAICVTIYYGTLAAAQDGIVMSCDITTGDRSNLLTVSSLLNKLKMHAACSVTTTFANFAVLSKSGPKPSVVVAWIPLECPLVDNVAVVLLYHMAAR